jgi:predicted tellurium resistance membrane protein TerC
MFVGVKMLISQLLHISAGVSFGVILGILGAGIGASVLKRRREEKAPVEHPVEAADAEEAPVSRDA